MGRRRHFDPVQLLPGTMLEFGRRLCRTIFAWTYDFPRDGRVRLHCAVPRLWNFAVDRHVGRCADCCRAWRSPIGGSVLVSRTRRVFCRHYLECGRSLPRDMFGLGISRWNQRDFSDLGERSGRHELSVARSVLRDHFGYGGPGRPRHALARTLAVRPIFDGAARGRRCRRGERRTDVSLQSHDHRDQRRRNRAGRHFLRPVPPVHCARRRCSRSTTSST